MEQGLRNRLLSATSNVGNTGTTTRQNKHFQYWKQLGWLFIATVSSAVFFAMNLLAEASSGIVGSITLAIILILFAFTNILITRPNKGIIFAFGEVIDVVGPGLYIKIPGIVTMVKLCMEDTLIPFRDSTVFTEDSINMEIAGGVWFVPNPDNIPGLLTLPLQAAQEKIRAEALSELKSLAASKRVKEIQKDRRGMEVKMKENIQSILLDEDGVRIYKIINVQIYDANEQVITKASEIEIIGTARANAAGKMKISLPEKGYQVQIASVVIDGLQRLASIIVTGMKGGNKRGAGAKNDEERSLEESLDSLAKGVSKLTGGE